MKFTNVAEAFNFYRNKTIEELEQRAQAINAEIDSNAEADIEALNIELRGIKEARENIELRSGNPGQGVNVITGRNFNGEGGKPSYSTPEDAKASPEYRSAFYKFLMGQKLSKPEQAAFDTVVEKRADAFSASTDVAAAIPTHTLEQVISKARTMGGLIQSVASTWITFDDAANPETFELERFKGYYAIGGADLSRSGDLTAATLLFMDKQEKRYVTQMYFLPKDNFEQRVKEEKIPYDKWYEAGLLRLCEGNSINYSDVTAWFLEMVEKYDVTPAWIYYDPYSAAYWVQEMQSHGFNMVKCYQGVKTLSLPMQQLGQDLAAKKVNYNANPLLLWCITNTGVKTDVNGNIQPIKATNPKYRIDGLASLLDAYVGLLDHYNEYLEAI